MSQSGKELKPDIGLLAARSIVVGVVLGVGVFLPQLCYLEDYFPWLVA